MRKNKLIHIFFYFFLFLFIPKTYAIVWEDLWLELYNSIDTWIDSLENEQFEYELTNQWNWSVWETVNNILLRKWVSCNIESVDDINIISDPNNEEQIQRIIERCSIDWEKISVNKANTILQTVSNIKKEYKNRARDKSKNMYELSKVWLYSDWDENNSPFDLISDLQEIDSIIFWWTIEYKEDPTTYGENDWWPCDDFFCIKIEYVMWTYDLLDWWWNDDEWVKSIKEILQTVIDHFKKFANTSLVQSKMTADNFEFSTIIESLPDMFRWFDIQVFREPVPIFEKDTDTNKEDLTRYKASNQLTRYYKWLNLDYDRKNDLSEINNRIEEKKVLQEAVYLSITEPWRKFPELNIYEDAAETLNTLSQVEIDRRTASNDMKEFYNQVSELQRFTLSIKDFCKSATDLIKKMVEIPIRSN